MPGASSASSLDLMPSSPTSVPQLGNTYRCPPGHSLQLVGSMLPQLPPPAAGRRSARAGFCAGFPRAPQWLLVATNQGAGHAPNAPPPLTFAQPAPTAPPWVFLGIVVSEADRGALSLRNRVREVAFEARFPGLRSLARRGWWEKREIDRKLRRTLKDRPS